MAERKDSENILDVAARKLRLPFRTPDFVDRIVSGSIDEAGKRTVQVLITTWDLAEGGPFAAQAIGATGMAKAIDIVYDQLVGPVFGPLLRAVGADRVADRAGLLATQLVGLGVVRYVARADPIRSMTPEELATAVAPTLQRYLFGDIS
ncbi:MAG: hypothetical protein QM662_08000 [Gordonia sp. (in: high G+C Gram-positive bacteria)]